MPTSPAAAEQIMADLLESDPAMFFRVATLHGETQDAAIRLMRGMRADSTPAVTVKGYLDTVGLGENRGYESAIGQKAAALYRQAHEADPEKVPALTREGRPIEVFGYRGTDVRFITEAIAAYPAPQAA
jgi:hypothetical protein